MLCWSLSIDGTTTRYDDCLLFFLEFLTQTPPLNEYTPRTHFCTDNDLEIFIRQDNAELINSPAIQDPTLTTWVYFDGRNYDNVELARGVYQDGMPVITEPLPGVYNADGSSRTGTKEQGSLYMTFDHDLKKMTVQRSSLQELDGDDPNVVAGFVITAMENCIARSATEFVLIFSSHGSG